MDYGENPQISYLREEYEKKIKECERLKEELNEAIEDMEFFNSLPWYERKFHKFDV